jgi:hypothetical protein
MNLKLSFNVRKFIPQNPKTKHNILIVLLIVLLLVGFVIFYNNFFRSKAVSLDVDDPKLVSGKKITSSEASESVINKIKKDIKRMQEELNNDFYSKLREFKPSGEIIVKPGRKNPFVL